MVCRLYHSPQGRARVFATGFHGRARVVSSFIRRIRGSCFFSAAKGAKPRVASLRDNQAVDLHCMHTHGHKLRFCFWIHHRDTKDTETCFFYPFFLCVLRGPW